MHGDGVCVLCINTYMNNLCETKDGLGASFKAQVSGFNVIECIFAQSGTEITCIMPSGLCQDCGCYLCDD